LFHLLLSLETDVSSEFMISLQLTQRFLFEDITHFLMWCLFAHFLQRWFFLQNLIIWSNLWHLKHCVMRQFFSNSLHAHSWYEFSILMFINWFIIALIAISTMSDEWIFSLFVIFFSQIILRTFRSSWSLALFFTSFSMIFFWLLVFIVVCTSCISTAKIQRATSIKNMLYTLHATYIEHNLYADFSLRLKKLLLEFSCNRFTVQEEWDLSLLRFQQFTS